MTKPATDEEIEHWSDCAVNNGPALPVGDCDCGGFKPIQATPATDELITYLESEGHTPDADDIPALIARIRSEQETVKELRMQAIADFGQYQEALEAKTAAEELARSIRVTTIRECAAIAEEHYDDKLSASNMYSQQGDTGSAIVCKDEALACRDISVALRALLEAGK